jgi:hypothetical protein
MKSQSNTSVDVVGTVYPLWVIVCERCGAVGTLFEKPGTGCKYVKHCHYCGDSHVRTEVVDSLESTTETVSFGNRERAEDYEQVQRIKARETDKQRT